MAQTITIPTDTYERLRRVAQDARDVAECNCGPTCEGTCTHGLATTVLLELGLLAPKAQDAAERFAELAWGVGDVQTLARLTDDEAADFLALHENRLRDRLTELGWEILTDMLTYDGIPLANDDDGPVCRFCGECLTEDAHGSWVDVTEGDCCSGNDAGENENGVHVPAEGQ